MSLTLLEIMQEELLRIGFLANCMDLIEKHSQFDIFVAKQNKKTEIALRLIESGIDLSNWHVIKEIKDEFTRY